MEVSNPEVFADMRQRLTALYGPDASFRDGQYEAIEAALTKHRTLVVQRTGWGKSLVYFLSTSWLREHNKGVTLVVSPLLALMQNQIDSAAQLGLSCAQINSRTKDTRKETLRAMQNGALDLVFVTPESLFRDDMRNALQSTEIGMLVVDEAHCISDWGHDFRMEYGRLREVIGRLPANVPLLATTATANDRVIEDLQKQLGDDLYVSRGPLARESLRLQVLHLESKAQRYAWILENLSHLDGSGIIYCLTQQDCEQVATFLQSNGVSAVAYHSGIDEQMNQDTEERFRRNEIKAIVATIKLGMGYDKDDISFVIHFQMPANIVSYYQQIGRAGRNIPKADVFLMTGKEDETILDYFIRTAFPSQEEMDSVMAYVRKEEGASVPALQSALNMRLQRITNTLMFLWNEGYVFKDGPKYYASPKPYVYQGDHYEEIKAIRRQEMAQMKELTYTSECLSKFITKALDDPASHDCGQCANCTGKPLLSPNVSMNALEKAQKYLQNLTIDIAPRKRWPTGVMGGKKIAHMIELGVCLCRYGDPGWGQLVKKGKYASQNRFADELVQKSSEVLADFVKANGITHVTCVPSLRTCIVEDFAGRLANQLHLSFVPLLTKDAVHQTPQKLMENSAHQCNNALSSFRVADGVRMPQRVLLVDDLVDSRWTLTVCGYLLMERGCEAVYPYALASSSISEGGGE